MPLDREVLDARIHLRVCELRVIAAQTFVELARREMLSAVAARHGVLLLPARRRLAAAFLLAQRAAERRRADR